MELPVPEDDAAAGEIVGRQLDDHSVRREDADVVLPHLARDVREHLVPVAQLDPEHRVGQRLHDASLDLDDTVLLAIYSANSCNLDWLECLTHTNALS